MGKKRHNLKQNPRADTFKSSTVSIDTTDVEASFTYNPFRAFKKFWRYMSLSDWDKTKDTIINFSLFFFVAVIVILTISLKAGEEFYSIGGKLNRNAELTNYYDVLGISRKSSNIEIRKAFRKLSLRWHPDKNHGCEPCLEKFRDISKAYEILGDEEKRKVYDSTGGGEIDIIPSLSETLNINNYEELVLLQTSNSWVIQVYTDHDELCQSFSPVWEESIEKMSKYYKFGRIHAKKEAPLIKKLPLNVKVFPAIFIITPGYQHEIYSKILDFSIDSFLDFLHDSFPQSLKLITSEKSFDSWFNKKSAIYVPKIIISSNKSIPTLLIRSTALRWSSVFDFSYIDNSKKNLILDRLGITYEKPQIVVFSQSTIHLKKKPDIIPLWDIEKEDLSKSSEYFDKDLIHSISRLSSLQMKLDFSLDYLKGKYVPFINTHNAKILCESNNIRRIMCLIIIHEVFPNVDKRVDDSLDILKNSRERYIKNRVTSSDNITNKIGDTEDADSDEEIFIQPVQLAISSMVREIPSMSKVSGFMHLFNGMKQHRFMLIDLDGDRFSELDTPVDIYQRVQEEEIFWKRFPSICTTFHENNFYKNCLFNGLAGKGLLDTITSLLKARYLVIVIPIYFTHLYMNKRQRK